MEMMAQTAGLLLGAESHFRDDVVFTKIDSARFGQIPGFGSGIEIEASPDGFRPEGGWFRGTVYSEGRPIAESRFLLMNVGRLLPEREVSVTFHKKFMQHYSIRDKVTDSASL